AAHRFPSGASLLRLGPGAAGAEGLAAGPAVAGAGAEGLGVAGGVQLAGDEGLGQGLAVHGEAPFRGFVGQGSRFCPTLSSEARGREGTTFFSRSPAEACPEAPGRVIIRECSRTNPSLRRRRQKA